jgi:hypothetical protein
MAKYFILDTNTLLHYRRPDRLDWQPFVGSEEVVLVITPALIHELEQQKLANRSARLRRRANEIIQWLNGYLEQTEPIYLSDQVRLQFYDESPRIDFTAHRLSERVPDDILIATAIQFSDQMNVEVSLITNDTGLRMKLRSRSISAVKPTEEDRLADEPDETELELVRTRTELQRFQARQPLLQLSFQDNTNFRTVDLRPVSEPPAPIVRTAWYFGHSEDSISDYENKYRAYLAEFQEWRAQMERMFLCKLIVRNTGSAEATKVSIEINFPEKVSLLKSSPKKPKPPRHPVDLAAPSFDLGDLSHIGRLLETSPLEASFDRASASVRWNIPSIVHNRRLSLRPFLVRFVSDDLAGFQARFTMGCAEVIDLAEGALNFKLEQSG